MIAKPQKQKNARRTPPSVFCDGEETVPNGRNELFLHISQTPAHGPPCAAKSEKPIQAARFDVSRKAVAKSVKIGILLPFYPLASVSDLHLCQPVASSWNCGGGSDESRIEHARCGKRVADGTVGSPGRARSARVDVRDARSLWVILKAAGPVLKQGTAREGNQTGSAVAKSWQSLPPHEAFPNLYRGISRLPGTAQRTINQQC